MKKKTIKYFIIILLFIISMINNACQKEEQCNCNPTTEKHSDHFIAHAGGQIDGNNYTNCVEAMDLSYSKGCKLFELDLVYTTDNKIIAKHDPPGSTENEFMSQLILGKYTPMNMITINSWFQNHPDAILVTDKINDPQRIFDEFNYHDRVIMELFTWESVDKAIELGITPLASDNLVFETENIETVLENKNIKYIGMSRYRIDGNEQFLKKMKNKGIRNYVWSLEPDVNGKSAEYYVWNYEMNFCYGMYANNLNILDSLLNNKFYKIYQ